MTNDARAAALTAFLDGKKFDATRLIKSMKEGAIGDPLMLQLLALSREHKVDDRVLLEAAAYDSFQADPQAYFNLGVRLQEEGSLARALLSYSQALRIEPRHTGALNNLSDLLRRQQRSEEAWQAVCAYINADGPIEGLEIRFAKIADDCGLAQEAEAWFSRAAARDPNSWEIAWEWSMQLLRDEKFAAGWRGFEGRKAIYAHAALGIVKYEAPEWEGSSLTGKALLVHKEQGLGDTIMFASCLPDIAGQAAQLHLAVQPPLARLMAANFPNAEVWPSTSVPGAEDETHQTWRDLAGQIDSQVPFGSLPLHLRSTKFPKAKAYLRPIEHDVPVWRERLQALAPNKAGKLRAGLVVTARLDGQVGAGVAEGPPKCLPARLAGGLAHRDVAWFGLHNLATADDLAQIPGLDIVDTSPWLYDLADTAALIANLDVVVAVDTAVAHLAGAMGKKVFLMLRRHSDWRWGRSRKDSYWYRDVEVFRQSVDGDWSPVVTAVSQRLAELVQATNAPKLPRRGRQA